MITGLSLCHKYYEKFVIHKIKIDYRRLAMTIFPAKSKLDKDLKLPITEN